MYDGVYCSGMELSEGLLFISRRADPRKSAVPEIHNNRSYHGELKLLCSLDCDPEIDASIHVFSEYHNISSLVHLLSQRLFSVSILSCLYVCCQLCVTLCTQNSTGSTACY